MDVQLVARAAAVDRRLLEAMSSPAPVRRAAPAVQAVSHLGDHAAVWLVLGALGSYVDRTRRGDWVRATGGVVVAHGAASVVKRAVRRPRPPLLEHVTSVSAASRHGFPSSHATAAAAAVVAFSGLVPAAVRVPVAAVVSWSRLALGVHHPSDVLGGAVLGWGVAAVLRRATP